MNLEEPSWTGTRASSPQMVWRRIVLLGQTSESAVIVTTDTATRSDGPAGEAPHGRTDTEREERQRRRPGTAGRATRRRRAGSSCSSDEDDRTRDGGAGEPPRPGGGGRGDRSPDRREHEHGRDDEQTAGAGEHLEARDQVRHADAEDPVCWSPAYRLST